MRRAFPDTMLKTVVRESARLGEAFTYARTIVEHDPDGMGAVDYRAVAGELVERWGCCLRPGKAKPRLKQHADAARHNGRVAPQPLRRGNTALWKPGRRDRRAAP